jgi:hypothetical protein
VTSTLPDQSQDCKTLLDELERLSPTLHARFLGQCRTVVVNLVLEEDRIESHGERRAGGLEPIPAHMHHGHTWARVVSDSPFYECSLCSAEPTTDPDWRGECARDGQGTY